MEDAFNLFEREEKLAGEAEQILAAGPSAEQVAMLARLLDGYRCLLHESKQLIRIADRRELELNRLNRKLHALTRSLAFQAEHDALTGAFNKAAIGRLLAEQLAKGGCCVMVLDIDHFKQVNDRHGHLAGDLAIKGVADRIQATIGDADSLGRFGGEEFVVLCPDDTPRLAVAKAERIRQTVADDPFDIGSGSPLAITVSVGLGEASCGESAETVLARVDAALYAAKHGGRNRVEVAR